MNLFVFCLLFFIIGNMMVASIAASTCGRSIFDTRTSWLELTPDEQDSRLKVPQTHPKDSPICSTFKGKKSCCTAKMLDDFQRWSDVFDGWQASAQYVKWLLENEPGKAFDYILILIRSGVDVRDQVDWQQIRTNLKPDVVKLIVAFWSRLDAPTSKIWSAVTTYQEGLLCSSCEPDFSPKFMDPTVATVKMKVAAPEAVFTGVYESMAAVDSFFADEGVISLIKNLAQNACLLALKSATKCAFAPTAVGLGLAYVTGNELRQIFCGKPETKQPDKYNAQCRHVILDQTLRGLFIDPQPIVNNVFDFFNQLCENTHQNCKPIEDARIQVNTVFFSFDTRPVATNVYSSEGFDVYAVACDSNLSGYACGGSGPQNSHTNLNNRNKSTNGEACFILLILLIVALSLVVLGAMFKYRFKIRSMVGGGGNYFKMGNDGAFEGNSNGQSTNLV